MRTSTSDRIAMANFDSQQLTRLSCIATVDYQPTVESTSDRAKNLLAQTNQPQPLLVIADLQTDGRGQPGKQWSANQESLTLTWCIDQTQLDSSLQTSSQGLLPLVAGWTVYESLKMLSPNCGERLSIKWPNDVLIDRKKVAGILVERIKVGQAEKILFGIGINVNQSRDTLDGLTALPSKSNFPPTSLSHEMGREFELQTVCTTLIECLFQRCCVNEFLRDHFVANLNERLQFIGQTIKVEQPDGNVVLGTCVGIGLDGELIVDDNGSQQRVFSGSIVDP